jgi:ribosomal protein S27E
MPQNSAVEDEARFYVECPGCHAPHVTTLITARQQPNPACRICNAVIDLNSPEALRRQNEAAEALRKRVARETRG